MCTILKVLVESSYFVWPTSRRFESTEQRVDLLDLFNLYRTGRVWFKVKMEVMCMCDGFDGW
jgi:hypothetical protein